MQNLKNFLFAMSFNLVLLMTANCHGFGLYDIGNTTTDPNASYRVFVTSQTTPGDMSFSNNFGECLGNTGVNMANCVCQQIAQNYSLSDGSTIFRAWLSQQANAAWVTPFYAKCNILGIQSDVCDNTDDRFKYVNMNGDVLFHTWADISSYTPENPVKYHETGVQTQFADDKVWTGTSHGGVESGYDCSGWTNSGGIAGVGTYGYAWNNDVTWTNNSDTTMACSNALSIYCFEGPVN